jgi:hypothetical protein
MNPKQPIFDESITAVTRNLKQSSMREWSLAELSGDFALEFGFDGSVDDAYAALAELGDDDGSGDGVLGLISSIHWSSFPRR